MSAVRKVEEIVNEHAAERLAERPPDTIKGCIRGGIDDDDDEEEEDATGDVETSSCVSGLASIIPVHPSLYPSPLQLEEATDEEEETDLKVEVMEAAENVYDSHVHQKQIKKGSSCVKSEQLPKEEEEEVMTPPPSHHAPKPPPPSSSRLAATGATTVSAVPELVGHPPPPLRRSNPAPTSRRRSEGRPGAFSCRGPAGSSSATRMQRLEVAELGLGGGSIARDNSTTEPGQQLGVGVLGSEARRGGGGGAAAETIAAARDNNTLSEEEEEEATNQVSNPIVVDDDDLLLPTATNVDSAELTLEIRNQILMEAALAEVVVQEEEEEDPAEREDQRQQKRNSLLAHPLFFFFFTLVVVLVLVVLILVFVVGLGGDESATPAPNTTTNPPSLTTTEHNNVSTMNLVRKRGFVRCGVAGQIAGFGYPNAETGVLEGINIDHCRAISMAVFHGDPDKVDLIPGTAANRFQWVADGTVDVYASPSAHTMDRDVFEPSSLYPKFVFTRPFLYSGWSFQGQPQYVDCAERGDSLEGICNSLKVCLFEGATPVILLKRLLPGAILHPVKTLNAMKEAFLVEDCNVIAVSLAILHETNIREAGYEGSYAVGSNQYSSEPYGLITRGDDHDWSALIDAIINVFVLAESHGISKSNAEEVYPLVVQGGGGGDQANLHDLAAAMESIVAELGNFGDLYERHFQQLFPRKGLNQLHLGSHHSSSSGGLLVSYPFGKADTEGPEPLPGSTMDKILSRGYIRCGLHPHRGDGFAVYSNGTWSGIDVELCRGISAGLFAGDTTKVEFVGIDESLRSGLGPHHQTKNSSSYLLLEEGTVDVVAGDRITVLASFEGKTFSSPYFFDAADSAFGLSTTKNDKQWSNFIFWFVQALILADEKGIDAVPVIELFGGKLKQCMLFATRAVGSYGDIYNRTLQELIPRAGANLLNEGPLYGPQMFPLPFI